jgi:outer membrane protein
MPRRKTRGFLMNFRRSFPAIALMLLATGAAAQDRPKIGYVNSLRLQNESAPALRVAESLKKEFAAREKQIMDLQKQIAVAREQFDKERNSLPPAEQKTKGGAIAAMMQRSDQLALSLSEDIEQRKSEELAKIVNEAKLVVKAIAEAGKFDLILEQVIYGSPGIDITNQVLKELAKRAGTPRESNK